MRSNLRKVTAAVLMMLFLTAMGTTISRSQNQPGKRNPAERAAASRTGESQLNSEKSRPMPADEKQVRDLYARLMRYQSAGVDELAAREDGSAMPESYLTFELRDIHSGSITEILDRPVSELIDDRSGAVINVTPNYAIKGDDPVHAYYDVEWTRVSPVADSFPTELRLNTQPPQTIGELLAQNSAAGLDRFTSYQVTVRLGGMQRTYRAIVVYSESAKSVTKKTERAVAIERLVVFDGITAEMNSVYREESPPVRAPWNKYVKSDLYNEITTSIKAKRLAGKSLRPAEAPIGYLPGDELAQVLEPGFANLMPIEGDPGDGGGGDPPPTPTPTPIPTPTPAPTGCQRVDILMNGNVITDQTVSVIVGAPINLTTRVTPLNATVSSSQWTVPPGTAVNPVASYTVVDAPTYTATTTLPNRNSPSINYYWVNGGLFTVIYTATVNGVQVRAQSTFSVLKPNATISTAEGTIRIATQPDGNLWLSFGDANATPGVRFGYTIQMPSGFTGGTFQWTQVLLSTHITLTENTGNVLTVQGVNVIDNQFAYPFVYNGFLEDSPDVRLDPDLQRVTRQDSFMTYLMFRPTGNNTIWVPLRQIPWSWNASATRTGTPNTWVLDTGHNHSVGADVNSTAEPLWSGSTRDLRAQ